LPHSIRRPQPQFNDRGRAPIGRREEDLPPQRHGSSRRVAQHGGSAAAMWRRSTGFATSPRVMAR
jgi:hypothetical protein